MILVFDIGKTNKKWVLFDEDLRVLADCSVQMAEIRDEDGFPCEDIEALSDWVWEEAWTLVSKKAYAIKYINVSAYGATIVGLNAEGEALKPVYNYLKESDSTLLERFKSLYDKQGGFETETGAPLTGMLNTGYQLFRLKQVKKDFSAYEQVLHLPQYLCYLLHGSMFSEPTSIGCHTALWDFAKADWHGWLEQENLSRLLPEVSKSHVTVPSGMNGKAIQIGCGIHDSSAALYPYVSCVQEPFILVSTGTWTICMNPFPADKFTAEDVKQDILLYKQPDGSDVRAARLFLGKKFADKIEDLHQTHGISKKQLLEASYQPDWERLKDSSDKEDKAYYDLHLFMKELTEDHIAAIGRAKGSSDISTIFVDGGFARNYIFLSILKEKLPAFKICAARKPMGSALGAAVVMEGVQLEAERFWSIYDIIEI